MPHYFQLCYTKLIISHLWLYGYLLIQSSIIITVLDRHRVLTATHDGYSQAIIAAHRTYSCLAGSTILLGLDN